jgi:polysaccharide biosynthesis protein PslG
MFTAQCQRRWASSKFLALLFVTCLTLSPASITAAAQPAHASRIAAAARALDAAAAASVRADHALVARATMVRACQIKHRKHCKASQKAVQRAGRKLNSSERHLSRLARRKSLGTSSSGATQAPLLTISGQTLSWNRPGNTSQFVFVRKVPGQADQYSVIDDTSTTPPPVPGYTVRYSVRTNVSGSVWASEKSISYPALVPLSTPPAEPPTSTPITPSPPTTTTPTPVSPTPPPSTPPSNPQTAPIITVSGQTLTWVQIADVSTYVLVSKVPGRADQYSMVSGTSITPPAVPDTTVSYSVRTAVEGSAWAPEVSIAYPQNAPAVPSAPVLSVQGNTVSWAALPGVTSYTLATVRNPATTRNTTYLTVTGTSYTPPVVPGQTVNYGLHARTPIAGPWAHEVSIAYPSQTPPPPPSEEPPIPTEPPSSPEPPNTSSGTFGLPFAKGVVANLQGWGVDNTPAIASEMSSLGVKWEREDLAWESVEAQKGVFNWTRFDQTVAAAKAQGITILPIVGYAPSWTSPTDSAGYARFVAAAVARYGPGTSANLQWWELWNEPYFAYAWSGHTPEPEAYAKDVLAAAEAAKGVAPSVKLLVSADYQGQPQVGGTTSSQTSWIDDMFTAAPTLGNFIDGVSVHPYGGDPALPLKESGGYRDTSGQWAFQRIDTIRNRFLAHNVNVPYWITEEGWSTWNFSEETVAHNYADLFPQIKARPWIRALFPFGLREGTAHPTNDQAAYGLLKYGTWQPKASWTVIQEGFKTLS